MYRGSSYKLDTMKTRYPHQTLERPEEALADAWQDFSKRPDEFTHEELLKHIPKQQRSEYHNRVLEAISIAELGPAIRLLLKLNEKNVLAERLTKGLCQQFRISKPLYNRTGFKNTCQRASGCSG